MNGGATIDTAGQDITIAQSLLAAGSGGLTKNGDGALTLTGANTYSGLTAVNAGKLILGSAQAATGNLTVAANATLAFLSTSNGTPAVSSVTMNGGAALEAQFQDTSGGNPTSAAGSINNLVLNGAVSVNLVATNITAGQFPLLAYNTISGNGSLATGQLPAGVNGTILTNTVNKTIDLLVSPSVSTNAVTLTNLVSGGNLNLSWPTDHTGWRLEVQTNSLTTGLSTNWFTWPDSTNVNAVSIPITAINPTVFFRLVYP
jgi:autotransporter-associated beta strand protein